MFKYLNVNKKRQWGQVKRACNDWFHNNQRYTGTCFPDGMDIVKEVYKNNLPGAIDDCIVNAVVYGLGIDNMGLIISAKRQLILKGYIGSEKEIERDKD